MKAEINKADLLAVKAMFAGVRGASKRIIFRSINKTLTNTKTFAAKEIGKDLNLTQKRIKQDFRENKANTVKQYGSVEATGKPVGLISFGGTRQLKAGVKVKIHKSKTATTLKHAFITTANNARNVFWRQWEGTRQKLRPGFPYARLPRQYRYPLERLTGPRVEDEYSKDKVINPVMKNAGERFVVNMDSQVSLELSKL